MKWLSWTQPDHGDDAISINLSTCRTECYSPKYSAIRDDPFGTWQRAINVYMCAYRNRQEHHNLLQQGCWAWQQQSMAGNVQDFIASNMQGCLKSRWHQEVSDFEVEWDQIKLYQKLRIG